MNDYNDDINKIVSERTKKALNDKVKKYLEKESDKDFVYEKSFEKRYDNYDEYETDDLKSEEKRKKENKRSLKKNVNKKKVSMQVFIVAGAMIIFLSGVGAHKKYEVNKGKERICSKITSCLYSNDIMSFDSSNGTIYYYKGHADNYINPTEVLLRDGFNETELAIYYNKVGLNFADDFNITLSERNDECLNEYYEMKLEEGNEKSNGR